MFDPVSISVVHICYHIAPPGLPSIVQPVALYTFLLSEFAYSIVIWVLLIANQSHFLGHFLHLSFFRVLFVVGSNSTRSTKQSWPSQLDEGLLFPQLPNCFISSSYCTLCLLFCLISLLDCYFFEVRNYILDSAVFSALSPVPRWCSINYWMNRKILDYKPP